MFEIIDTTYLHDKAYVDLVIVNGRLQTHVMKKIAEPNVFKSVIEADGDHRGSTIIEMKKRRT